ncbi:NfeD family protein [Paenibacillus sacheonensis]|uniref:Protease n=1 Tax=Paenibacillus sacheonensis TaxID=742054 RepID=A0A7X4YRI7_9BACL|nr:NfeD family protein [Paenibacillus sacheonensis]MBM7563546.1 membrane-bound ClpP family serine protease [Paenibacillus sacheonensis]NBC71155.1 protease [Paenibacillus sacheonensis]
MEGVFLGCLFGGIFFAIVSVVLGDWLSLALDGMLDFLSLDGVPVLQPTAVVGGITVFGGAGLLLEHHSGLGAIVNTVIAVLLAVIAAIGIYLLYIRPMERSEQSTGYSMKELNGMIGDVIVPIPATGFGEVTVKVGAGLTNHIAASFDGMAIPSGTRVVVIRVEAHTLLVSKLEL